MRVLWLSHFLPFPPKGGALQRSYHLLREVSRAHEVHLVSLNQRAILPTTEMIARAENELGRIVASVRCFPIPSDRSGVDRAAVLARWGFGREPYDVVWLRSSPLRRYLDGLRSKGLRFELIHVDTIGLWPYTGRLRDGPTVLNHHNVESSLVARRGHRERRVLRKRFLEAEARKLARLERTAGRQATTNVVVSEAEACRFRAIVPRAKVAVIENGVDVDYFKPAPSTTPEPGTLLFVGTLDWYPNRDAAWFLIREILPELERTGWSGRLTLVGRSPVGELGGDHPRVRTTGFVEDARPYFDAAEVYVCPIREGGGTRLKVLDALAMAKPLVATELAVEGLALVEEEHYLRAESPQEFASQVLRLGRDGELRRRLGENGRRVVRERYSWSLIGRRLLRVYDEAAALSQSGPAGDLRWSSC